MCTIVEFQHVKPGKGGAFVRTKLRDIKTGRVVDYTFNAGTKFDTVRLEQRTMQYLYDDGADFNFMDPNTYEQMPIPHDQVGLIAYPIAAAEMVTLHELCHFVHPDHSKDFYALMQTLMPDWKARKKLLSSK